MKIPCFRCGKEINTPDSSNADYVIAQDMIATEPREVLIALQDTTRTKAKRERGEVVLEEDLERTEVPNITFGNNLPSVVKILAEVQNKQIQKSGIICPEDYRATDTVIWGVHK